MKNYKKTIIDILPLLLLDDFKTNTLMNIKSYVNGMIRKVKNEEDLKYFLDTMLECMNFANKNNIEDFNKNCNDWYNQAISKYPKLNKNINEQQNTVNSIKKLKYIDDVISKNSVLEKEIIESLKEQLDEIENQMKLHGSKYFNKSQLDQINIMIIKIKNNINSIICINDINKKI